MLKLYQWHEGLRGQEYGGKGGERGIVAMVTL